MFRNIPVMQRGGSVAEGGPSAKHDGAVSVPAECGCAKPRRVAHGAGEASRSFLSSADVHVVFG